MSKPTYCLNDRINLMEYKSKTVRWLIATDPGLVRVCLSAGDFRLTRAAKEILQVREIGRQVYMEDYTVQEKAIMSVFNEQRNLIGV